MTTASKRVILRQINPNNCDVYKFLGLSYEEKGLISEAKESLEHILQSSKCENVQEAKEHLEILQKEVHNK